MNNPKVLILTLLSLFVMAGCQQDDPLSPPGGDENVWQAFYKSNGAQPQTFTVDAETGGTFEGKQGMTLVIPPNAFVNNIGRKVSGEVTVRFCEFPSLGDLFVSGLHTMTLLGPLVTAGSFKFEAEQDGEILKIAYPEGAQVLIPAKHDLGIYGEKMYSSIWGNHNSWRDTAYFFQGFSNSSNPLRPDLGNVYEAFFYGRGIYTCSASPRWGYSPIPPYTSFSVKLKNASIADTRVVMVVKDFPALVEVSVVEGDMKRTYDYSILERMEGRLVAVSMEDGELKYGYQDVKIMGNDIFEIEVSSGKLKDLKALLDNPF